MIDRELDVRRLERRILELDDGEVAAMTKSAMSLELFHDAAGTLRVRNVFAALCILLVAEQTRRAGVYASMDEVFDGLFRDGGDTA